MAKAKAKPHPLQPGGLAVAFLGLLLALWSFTGDRAFTFAYFFLAVLGVILVIGGIAVSAYGRAVAPRRKRVVRDAPPPPVAIDGQPRVDAPQAPDTKPARRGFLTRLRQKKTGVTDASPEVPVDEHTVADVVEGGSPKIPVDDNPVTDEVAAEPEEVAPKRSLLSRLRAHRDTSGPVEDAPITESEVDPLPDETSEGDVRCPACAHRFYLVDPTLKAMTCPNCGLRGRIPVRVADSEGPRARRMKCPSCATAFRPDGAPGSVAACPRCGLRGRVP